MEIHPAKPQKKAATPAVPGVGLQHIGRAGHSPGPAGSLEAPASNVDQNPAANVGKPMP